MVCKLKFSGFMLNIEIWQVKMLHFLYLVDQEHLGDCKNLLLPQFCIMVILIGMVVAMYLIVMCTYVFFFQ